MTSAPGQQSSSRTRKAGFTLVELVLVLSVLALLAGVTAVNLGGFGRSQELSEGASRLETALRLTRADAAGEGRRIRLQPDAETGGMDVLWEPNPLTEPGEFRQYPCSWRGYLPGGSVRVVSSRLTGDSRYRSLWSDCGRGDASSDMEALTFYPDGTSDSAEIELEAPAGTAILKISGLTGVVSRETFGPDEGVN